MSVAVAAALTAAPTATPASVLASALVARPAAAPGWQSSPGFIFACFLQASARRSPSGCLSAATFAA